MLNFSTIPYTTGAFPNVEGVDSTTPTSKDGTPYNEDVLNDIWGWMQALMSRAGNSPTGVKESSSVSQLLDAQKKIFGHPGEMFFWAGWNFSVSKPADFNLRLLLCRGQGILISEYQDLVDTTYVGDAFNSPCHAAGGAFYKATDATGTTPSTSGLYFILPDFRGKFMRVLDPSGFIDPDSNRYVGEPQSELLSEHTHPVTDTTGAFNIEAANFIVNSGAGTTITIYNEGNSSGSELKTANPVGSGTELRPANDCIGDVVIRY